MENNRSDKAVSDIVGTVLLLGMTIALFSVLCVGVLSYPSNPSKPAVNLVATIDINDGRYLFIEHRGGETLNLDTKVIITIDNNPSTTIIVRDENYLTDEAKKDNKWGIGEALIYPLFTLEGDNEGGQLRISVVDVESNSVIMQGRLQIPGEG